MAQSIVVSVEEARLIAEMCAVLWNAGAVRNPELAQKVEKLRARMVAAYSPSEGTEQP